MTISGAVIIRNGVKLGYPFIQSIQSLVPVCDEVVVGVGDSDDGTRERVAAIGSPKIRIIDTVWDMSRRTGGLILSEKTNEIMRRCSGDWIFYLQSDEAISERDIPALRASIERAANRSDADGLYFEYLHFYGSYYMVQPGRNWYRREVRLVKNGRDIVSHGDAQGFRRDGKKIRALPAHARVFHYGWARPPAVMAEKIKSFHRFWHDDAWIAENCSGRETGEFFSDLGNLREYAGDHPAVMEGLLNRDSQEFIERCRTEYLKKRTLSRVFKDWLRALPFGDHWNFRPIR